ncbi:MAG: hypothetical protein IJX67_08060 [Oscillospiraceae bacterium]|nr:hypothetical protein [Oscillospiraceae bacterium]
MRIESNLSPEIYIAHLKRQLGRWYSFGDERFTGFVLGRFFSIVYHSGFEENRRITNEKNRAIGYAKDTPDGTEVRFIRLYGLTNPISLAALFLLGFGVCMLLCGFREVLMADHANVKLSLICGAVYAASVALSTAIGACITERGLYGRGILMNCLKHPDDPYTYRG